MEKDSNSKELPEYIIKQIEQKYPQGRRRDAVMHMIAKMLKGDYTDSELEKYLEIQKGINEASNSLFQRFRKHSIIAGTALVLGTLFISYSIVTYFARKDVRVYSEQYISQGKQYYNLLNRIEAKQNKLENQNKELFNKKNSLEKNILDQASKLYLIEKDIAGIDKSSKNQFSSLEKNLNEQKTSLEQFKSDTEGTMKSDYKEFLELNNSTLKEVRDLSAKLIALEKELPKALAYDKRLNDLVSDVNNLDTTIKELNRNIEKIDREGISKEDFNKLKNELEVIKKDYKPLKEKIESMTKQE